MPVIPKKYIPIVAGSVIVVALVAIILLNTTSSQEGGIAENGSVASTTEPVGGTTTQASASAPVPKKKGLPPEPAFILPEGAIALDEYAFAYQGSVYFRSITDGTKSLHVPTADPDTFRRLQDFSTYPGGDVVRDCGAAPIYTFYVDSLRPYFYQIWRAPEYRASRVDAMNGADLDNFSVTGLTSATDGRIRFDIAYKLGTTTCRLMLNQTLL